MKFLDTINGSIKKFGKGMFAIFAIKLLLFGGAFIIQSCQTDPVEDSTNIEQELALSKFESLVRTSTPKIQSVMSKQQNLLLSRSENATDVSAQTEEDVKEAMMPLVNGSKELLLSLEITEEDLLEEFEDLEDPRIALVGMLVLAASSEENNQTAFNFTSIFITSSYAQSTGGKVWDCALEAIGVGALIDSIEAVQSGNKAILKKVGKKAIKKLASRVLGPIGAAIAAVDFAICLNRD